MGSLNLAAVTATTPYIKKIQSALAKATGQTIVTPEFRKIKRVAGVSVLPVTFFFSGGATLTLYVRALADVVKAELNEKVIVLSGDFSDDYKPTFDNAVNVVAKLIREAQSQIQDQNKREKVRLPPRRTSVDQKTVEVEEQEQKLDEELVKQTAQRDQLLEKIELAKQQLGISSITEAGQSDLGKSISEIVSISTDTNINIFEQDRLTKELDDVKSYELKNKRDALIPLSSQKLIVNSFIPLEDLQRIESDLTESEEIIVKAKEYGLTMPEQISLRYWSSDGFAAYNGVLHKTLDWSEEKMQVGLQGVALLRQALDKLPNFTDEVIYSRQHFPQNLIDQLISNAQYTFEGFIAGNAGYDVFSHRNQRLIITSKTGKHIAWISENNATEDEVLFKNLTSFVLYDIVNHENDPAIPAGHSWFYLEEV